jgi:cobalt-zinc-cadmium resistance protein CzcA
VQGLVLGLRGANAGEVVEGVKARLAELAPSLPPGVEVQVFYDRSELVGAGHPHSIESADRGHRSCAGAAPGLSSATCGLPWWWRLMLPLAALATFILQCAVSGMSSQPDEPGWSRHRHRHAGGCRRW